LIDQALDYNKVSDEIERQITDQISKLSRKGESEEKIPEDELENNNNSENSETISNDENYNKIKDVVYDNMRDKAMDNWIKFYRGYVFVKLIDEYNSCENLKIFMNELK
jgi:hypothetical protein